MKINHHVSGSGIDEKISINGRGIEEKITV